MSSMNEFPEIMREARVDLAGNLGGQFSPQDWESILTRAKAQLEASSLRGPEAWVEVIRDFHRENYWGFVPNYIAPKTVKNIDDENLGVRMLLYAGRSFLLTKIAIVWFGALWSISGEPFYKYCFFASILFMLVAYGTFLYKYGHRNER